MIAGPLGAGGGAAGAGLAGAGVAVGTGLAVAVAMIFTGGNAATLLVDWPGLLVASVSSRRSGTIAPNGGSATGVWLGSSGAKAMAIAAAATSSRRSAIEEPNGPIGSGTLISRC